ncbi:LytTR family two component transcriptional regulator [Chitinophaga skermanii]|uniref:LytTR family two component transcriptional regulator n=1 Tax=Chitinophaga skermanii TaxID=331697 RepID=A0A327R650_9BACT|nr:LytTR family DNA-binding domain-containing protein [Chitinophaga skermanii]RAJ11063.1 LytTR family two component transcriptional regulator [Chitinophaga skermanii]
MINCIIVDDEQHAIDLLVHHIGKTPFLNLVFTSTDPVEALQVVNSQKIDLVFLDVQMPTMTGIDFIKAINGKSKVILTTAYSEYAFEGFENDVLDYLLKPISFARFIKGAQRAMSFITPIGNTPSQPAAQEEDDFIFVKTEQKGKLIKINLPDIVYIEGLKNYVSINTQQGEKIIALLNIKDLEERLPAGRFTRTHKSFIIATAYITMIEGNMVHLENTSSTIPIGDTYREPFMAQMKEKIMSNKK